MQRRKLTAYTLMFAAGIAAGFFITERQRIAESVLFIVSVTAVVLLCPPGDEKHPASRANAGGAVRSEGAQSAANIFRIILLVMLMTGILSMTTRNAGFKENAGKLTDGATLRCRILSFSLKDDKYRLIVKNLDDGPSRVLVTADAGLMSGINDAFYENVDLSVLIGSEAEISGEFSNIYGADDPGCFDYSIYMKARGVCVRAKAYSIRITDPRNNLYNRYRRSLIRKKEMFLSRFDPDTAGFIRGVLFGDKSGIDEDTLREFNENSTGHILAVSGLHMGFLYALLRLMSGKKRSLRTSLFIIAVMLVYGDMTMWSSATLRAFLVISLKLLSVHLKRPFDLLTSVSFAALLIMIREPYQLFDTGFQLSFCAMAGMSVLVKPVSSAVGEALGVMISVQTSTLPVIAFTYGCVDPLAIFINIPIILMASFLVPLCILMMIPELFSFAAPSASFDLAGLMSYAVIKINHLLNFGGGFSIKTAGTGAFSVLMFYAAALGLASEWTRVKLLRKEPRKLIKAGALLLIPAIMFSCCLYDRFSDDEIVFVAVGQGECTHISCGGTDVLIDGGGQPGYDGNEEGYNVGEKILMPYLLREGADNVDIALLTHLHADHYKGIAELAAVYPVGARGIPADYKGSDLPLTPGDPAVIYMEPGAVISVSDDVSIEVIWPVSVSADPLAADDPNEHNTVYMIRYGSTKVMVTGDLLEEDELQMIEYYAGTDTLTCDVLQIAHHGSKTSTSEAFLDAASPQIAVIQAGRDNLYGHPHKQTLERLEKRGIKVFRTDLNGAVGLDIKNGRIMVDLFRNN